VSAPTEESLQPLQSVSEGDSRDREATARVTIVVPCYNDGALVLEAIASIDEREPVDVIVVDDGSTAPETVELLDGLAKDRTTVIRHEENRGLAIARNTALEAASTPYVFPLDADDLAIPFALAKMADKLDAEPDAAVCFGDYLEFGDHEIVRAVPERLDPFRLAYVNEYPVSSLLRREVVNAIGGWRKAAPAYEDWDLWLTLAEHGYRGVHLGPGELTFRKRFHGERMLAAAKRTHHALYRRIQQDHPGLYSDIGRHRRESDLPLHRKLLYPVVYGARPRFTFERHVKHWLDRRGIWTLRR
jgi:glycosyltransferase involved in cell wall biosynthesis